MARSAVIGNGGLTVGLDEKGLVHDFYYPYVGLENLNDSRAIPHYIGVSVNGKFSWLHEDGWSTNVKIHQHAMITQSRHTNENLGVSISIESYVDYQSDVFVRKVVINNKTTEKLNVKLFFHQIFQISSEGRSDTAMYVPDGHYILDYKGRCVLLIKAITDNGEDFDQYAVGNYKSEGKYSTYKDAEDGKLSMNAVEHAGVDSTIRVSLNVDPKSYRSVNYWVAACDSQIGAREKSEILLLKGFDETLHEQLTYWQSWLAPIIPKLKNITQDLRKHIIVSLFIIKAHIDKRGGIIASCDSSIYNYGRDYYSYVWPRDGAFVIWPLIRLGFNQEAKNFFIFCRDVMTPSGYMMHKYQPDKAIGSTWHPLVHGRHSELAIQEDETALVIFMLGEYVQHTGDKVFAKTLYLDLVQPAANFMLAFIDDHTRLPHPSYDLWEEKFLSTTFTSGATYKALLVASELARIFKFSDDFTKWQSAAQQLKNNSDKYFNKQKGYFNKGFIVEDDLSTTDDTTLDVSSLYGCFMFDYSNNAKYIASTAKSIEEKLLDSSPSGGSPRYENDKYFRRNDKYSGNPWFVTTLWVAQFYIRVGQIEMARKYLDWTMSHALETGVLSEQVDPENGEIVSVTPLVWSHAELINTILDLEAFKS